MADRVVDRRMLLRGAGVAGATVIGGAALVPAAHANGDHRNGGGVTGAWVITHRDDPPNPPEATIAVVSFAEGGVFSVQDIAPLAPGGLGAWSSEHGDRFAFNFWTGFPAANGSPAAIANIRGKGEVHHDTISGTYSFTVYSAKNRRKVLQKGTGKFSGHRLEA